MYGQSRGFGPRKVAPVQIGDELDVEIESVGEKGDGVAKIEGFVLFIPGVQKGDKVKIKVTKVFRKVGFAEVVGQSEGKTEEEKPATEEESSEEPKEQAEPAPEKKEKKVEEEKPAEDSENFGE
jgi:predicted RNA-binding protein with TRAM domain